MVPVFGVHVGNSTASLAICKEDGKVTIIANDAGDRVTPTVVTFIDREEVVGTAAKTGIFSKLKSTVVGNKRLMDRNLDEDVLSRLVAESRLQIDLSNKEPRYGILNEEKTIFYTPAKVATCIYKKLYNIAKSAIHDEDEDICCVLLVPVHFDKESRDYTRQAAESAGWEVLQVVNEPSVAPLAYNIGCSDMPSLEPQYVLVFRIGGYSSNTTILQLQSGMFTILANVHSANVGGNQITVRLREYFAEEFYKKFKLDPTESVRSTGKLHLAAENSVQILSSLSTSNCFVESLFEGVDFNHSLSRARLESLLSTLLPTYFQSLYDAMEQSNLKLDDICKVILCGGALKMPKLQSSVQSMFVNAEVLSTISPDEVLACGAAQQAKFISQLWDCDQTLPEPVYSLPVLKQPITIKVVGSETKTVVFEEDLPIPSSRKITVLLKKPPLSLCAKQLQCEGSCLEGTLSVVDLKVPTSLEIKVSTTLQNEIEVLLLNTGTKETQNFIIPLQEVKP